MRELALWFVAAAALRSCLIYGGWCDNAVIADDAFYYFTIARNAALNLGVTFDGLAVTNGFHPLYLICLVPLFGIGHVVSATPWALVHSALLLCMALDLVTGFLLIQTLRDFARANAVRLALAVWLFSPLTVLLTLRGLEASLSAACVSLCFLLFARLAASSHPRVLDALAMGIAIGLATLARTDNGPFLALAAVVAASTHAYGSRRAMWRNAAGLAIAGIVAGLVILPWLIWSHAHVGSIWQVSGAVKQDNPHLYGHGAGAEDGAGLGPLIFDALAPLWSPALYLAGEGHARLQMIALLVVLGLIATIIVLSLSTPREQHGRPQVVLTAAIYAYVLAHMAAYGVFLRAYAVWYAVVPVYLVGCLLLALAAGAITVRSRKTVVLTAFALAALAISIYAAYFRATGIQQRGQEHRVARLLRLLPPMESTVTVGLYNAGAAGYFAQDYGPFRVVNLDGVVNNAAFRARQQGRYLQYYLATIDVAVWDAPDNLRYWFTPEELRIVDAAYPRVDNTIIHGPRLNRAGARVSTSAGH